MTQRCRETAIDALIDGAIRGIFHVRLRGGIHDMAQEAYVIVVQAGNRMGLIIHSGQRKSTTD